MKEIQNMTQRQFSSVQKLHCISDRSPPLPPKSVLHYNLHRKFLHLYDRVKLRSLLVTRDSARILFEIYHLTIDQT